MEIIFTLKEIDEAANRVLDINAANKVFIFNGEMGAGKTTFAAAFCKALGVNDIVSSPTYSLIQEYKTGSDENVYHMDFYRLNTLDEAIEAGAEEYLVSGEICLVEWPQKIQPLLPDHYISLDFQIMDNVTRKMLVQLH